MDAIAQTPSLPSTFTDFKPAPAKQAIAKIRYSHDAMIDMIVANPWISQGTLAENFGYTEGWVSQVIASDAFQARLAQRKNELIDPHLRATIEERFKGLVVRSLEVLMRRLDEPTKVSDELLIKALEVSSKAAGYGAKTGVQINNNFVVAMPPKSATSADWAKENGAGGSAVESPPARRALQEVTDAVLVSPGPASPTASDLLKELKSTP